MTAFGQFDPFEQRIAGALDEIAPARRPDYLDDLLRQTARTPQRPRWRFAGAWIPALDTTTPTGRTRAPVRPLVLVGVLALLALAAAAAMLIAGSQPRVPLPVGLAANGGIIYSSGGDIVLRESLEADAATHSLVTGPTKQYAPFLSPDGQSIAYAETRPDGDYFWVVDVDGSNPRQVLDKPVQDGWSQWSWALDSKHLLMSGEFADGNHHLYDVQADGTGARELVFDGLVPWEAFWSPVDPDLFVMRAHKTTGVPSQDLYLANAAGTELRPLGLPGQSAFGTQYTLSGAAWAPDGKTIAYNAITLDGESFTTRFRVHLVNPDGTDDRELPAPDDPKVHQAWPVFSPDGTRILVQRFIFPSADGAKDAAGWIAVVPADGSSSGRDIGMRVDQTDNPDTVKVWSPDGRHVLQWVSVLGSAYVVSPDTGAFEVLSGPDDVPDWQRTAP